MLKKINKKRFFVALFMAAIMTITLVTTASAQISPPSIGASITSCPCRCTTVRAHVLSTTGFEVAIEMGCNHARCRPTITSVVILDNNQVVFPPRIQGRLINGEWSAYLDYSPPTGRTIQAANYSIVTESCGGSWGP